MVWFGLEDVALPWLPELSKVKVILMKYQQLTHSKNGQILKVKKSITTKKSATVSSLYSLLFKLFFFEIFAFFLAPEK